MGVVVPTSVGLIGAQPPIKAATSFFTQTGVGNAAVAALLPASNVNGVRVVSFHGDSAGTTTLLYTGIAPPASYADLTKQMMAMMRGSSGLETILLNRLIPAGYGLWFIASAAGVFCSVDFEIL